MEFEASLYVIMCVQKTYPHCKTKTDFRVCIHVCVCVCVCVVCVFVCVCVCVCVFCIRKVWIIIIIYENI